MNLYGLIGFPLSHSFSAGFFEKKFADENITDAQYRLFPLEDISSLPQLLKHQQNLQGFNITIPYKVAILPQLDHISKVAASVGAVNCIKVTREQSGTKLSGFNTDVYGFRESLIPLLKPYHYQALVLGTGGAAKAVCYSLLELGISYAMVSRTGREKSHLQYSELTQEIMNENTLIINATPAGMYPHIENFPNIPYQFLSNRHVMYDLIYNPAETQFLQKSKEAGAITKNGFQMLELQAQKSWEIWNSVQ